MRDMAKLRMSRDARPVKWALAHRRYIGVGLVVSGALTLAAVILMSPSGCWALQSSVSVCAIAGIAIIVGSRSIAGGDARCPPVDSGSTSRSNAQNWDYALRAGKPISSAQRDAIDRSVRRASKEFRGLAIDSKLLKSCLILGKDADSDLEFSSSTSPLELLVALEYVIRSPHVPFRTMVVEDDLGITCNPFLPFGEGPPAVRSIAEFAYWSGEKVCYAVPREAADQLIEAVRRGLGWYPLNAVITNAEVEGFATAPGKLLSQTDRGAIRGRATGIMVSSQSAESLILAWSE